MDIVRILLTVTRPFSFTFLDAVYRIIFGAKQELPPIEDKILLITATELAQKIRRKEVNCVVIVNLIRIYGIYTQKVIKN